MQSEHVSDPAEPGLRSAKRGGITLFQKGGPNIIRQNCHAPLRLADLTSGRRHDKAPRVADAVCVREFGLLRPKTDDTMPNLTPAEARNAADAKNGSDAALGAGRSATAGRLSAISPRRKIEKRKRNLKKETSLWHSLYLQMKFVIASVERYFKNINSGIICDFGCDDKPYEVFCGKGVQYIGIDIDEENDKADIFASVCDKIPLKDELADYCVRFFVLEHVEEPQNKTTEMYRILKTGGELFILIPLYWEEHDEKPYDFFRFTRFGIEHLLKKARFKEIVVTPLNGSFSLFYFFDKRSTHKGSSNVMTYAVTAKK